jgi:hypothetical protein
VGTYRMVGTLLRRGRILRMLRSGDVTCHQESVNRPQDSPTTSSGQWTVVSDVSSIKA